MNVWPDTLPQCLILGRSGEIGDPRISSKMDAGGLSRRRLSYVPQPLSGSMVMTTDQRRAFEEFVNGPLKGGVLPFRFPAQGEGDDWIVQIGQAMPSWTQTASNRWTVNLNLVRLPQ